jgi:hypothetical protein
MKLPRWVVVSVLSLSALSGAIVGVLSWLTWPQATARRFAVLLAEGKLQDAQMLVDVHCEIQLRVTNWPRETLSSDLTLWPRSFSDIVTGRQRFMLSHQYYTFTAQLGRIVDARNEIGY